MKLTILYCSVKFEIRLKVHQKHGARKDLLDLVPNRVNCVGTIVMRSGWPQKFILLFAQKLVAFTFFEFVGATLLRRKYLEVSIAVDFRTFGCWLLWKLKFRQ